MEAEEFKILMRQAYGPMLKQAVDLLHDTGDAQEIVQQVCVRLWEHPELLERADKQASYCIRAVHHAAISYLRSHSKFDSIDSLNAEPATTPCEYENEYIEQLIGKLPATQQAAFMMRMRDDLEYDEIAEKLNLKTDNVRQLISRARKKLRDLYGKYH